MANDAARDSWRHFTIMAPIKACRIRYGDVKRLYDLIDEKQKEELKRIQGILAQQPKESAEEFDRRKVRVTEAFRTLATVTGPDGEMVTGHGRDFFDGAAIPENVKSVLIDTANQPKNSLNTTPENRISLFLDFSKPPIFNYGVMPSAPTQNSSSYTIVASSEAWATSLNARLRTFFDERKSAFGWLHSQGCYDALLMFIGLPVALWGTYRMVPNAVSSRVPGALTTAIYVYVFFVLLNVFRAFFSYSRWVFPLVELHTDRATLQQKHRLIWGTIFLAVAGSFVYDVIKFLLTS